MQSEQPAGAGPAPSELHRATVEERGSFCFARCACGWQASGRRSRDRARRDLADHLAEAAGHG
ncbi:hypothetical protein [Kitasatospora paranensis]|uniref:Uncharacterized protein n=1 Tax=Kitasatospora paranensis TaxID=258053 RepID=A0ABW2FSV6_9ACTN